MKTKMNELQVKAARAARPRTPLEYAEACYRYTDWYERESAKNGVILLGVPQPNRGLSEVVGSTWHLKNVNGPLARVGASGRVWRPRREGT